MVEKNQIYKCGICGNIIEVLHVGGGTLVCCGKPMQLLEEKTQDPVISAEKHVPIIEKTEKGIKIKIGSVEHPMLPEHYIEFIELIETKTRKIYRKFLNPGDKPEAEFCIDAEIDEIVAREYCNLHGLWKSG